MEDNELYEGYEEDKVAQIQGITDTVTDLSFTKISYPAIVFKEGFKMPRHKIMAISNMVKSSIGSAKKDISLYYQNGGELFKMGMLSGQQVMPLLDIVPRSELMAFYDDGMELTDGKIYTLCNFSYT